MLRKEFDPNQIYRKTLPFEAKAVKAATDGEYAGTIEGYAAGIHNIDRAGDMILPGAFNDDLARFLSEGVVCWQHDWMTPIGKPLEAKEDAYGLWTKSQISKTTQGENAMVLIRDGVVKKMSIGYRVTDYQWVDRSGLQSYLSTSGLAADKQGDVLSQYDEADLDELFLIKKLKLYEYSPVSIPANPNAIITEAKGLPFAEHSKAVLTSVRELSERIKSISSLRKEANKKPNQGHLNLLDSLSSEVLTIHGLLLSVADDVKASKSDQPNQEAVALYAEHLRQQARALGCAV